MNESYREIKSVSKCAISQTAGNTGTKYSVEDSSSFCKMYAQNTQNGIKLLTCSVDTIWFVSYFSRKGQNLNCRQYKGQSK